MMDKETIKEFLRPNLAHISLFVAICLIGVFVGSNFLGYLAWGKSEVRTITFYAEFNSFFWFPLKIGIWGYLHDIYASKNGEISFPFASYCNLLVSSIVSNNLLLQQIRN